MIAAIAGVPLAVVASGVFDSYLNVSSWGSFGYNSSNSGGSSLAVGSGNTLASGVYNSLTVGLSLTAYDSNSMVVGIWNEDTNVAAEERFIVGAGTYATPQNALEVLDDGTIRIPKVQSDIPLGEFGEAEE